MGFVDKVRRLVGENPGRTILSIALVSYAAFVLWGSREGWFVQEPTLKKLTSWGVFHVSFWAFGPPVWFFFEYHLEANTKKRKQIKDSADLASKVWAAVLAVLAVTLLK
jgi:hypothetical protein